MLYTACYFEGAVRGAHVQGACYFERAVRGAHVEGVRGARVEGVVRMVEMSSS